MGTAKYASHLRANLSLAQAYAVTKVQGISSVSNLLSMCQDTPAMLVYGQMLGTLTMFATAGSGGMAASWDILRMREEVWRCR